MAGLPEDVLLALRAGNEQRIKEALLRGVHVDAKDAVRRDARPLKTHRNSRDPSPQTNSTALMLAAQFGHVHLVRFLLCKGATVDAVNRVGHF